MKKQIEFFKSGLLVLGMLITLSSCGLLIGGRKYRASIMVKGHPNATIEYKGKEIGRGFANITIPRVNANKLSFTVSEPGCEKKVFQFRRRKLRGGAIVGSLLLFTTNPQSSGFFIPYGLIIDFLVGSVYKPNANEYGVLKTSYNSYQYILDYSDCDPVQNKTELKQISKSEKLRELKKLLDERIITQEEFDKEKAKILNSDQE